MAKLRPAADAMEVARASWESCRASSLGAVFARHEEAQVCALRPPFPVGLHDLSAHGADWIPKCGKRASGCIFGLECRHVSANLRSQGFCDVIVSLVRTHSPSSFLPLSAITSVFAAAGQSATPAFGCKSLRPSRIGYCRKRAGFADRTQERKRDRREDQPGWICRAAGPAAVTSNGGLAGCGCQSCLPNPAIVGAQRGRDHS